jgi:hypothetical protein
MTEHEWLDCGSVAQPGMTHLMHRNDMLRHLQRECGAARRKAGRRKLRLLACAFCRRAWKRIDDPRGRTAVEVAEQFADGLAGKEELAGAGAAAWEAEREARGDDPRRPAAPEALERYKSIRAAWWATAAQPYESAHGAMACVANSLGRPEAACDIIREVFGNPFRPPALGPAVLAWNGGTVRRVAQALYDERAFDRLPVLADALEDAGCAEADLLSHCRGPGPHMRGCWAVDLCLGRE